jgi:hypothetical protein
MRGECGQGRMSGSGTLDPAKFHSIDDKLQAIHMGLFCSVIHIYQRTQEEVMRELSDEWKENFGISTIRRIDGTDSQVDAILGGTGGVNSSVDYLVTKPQGNWTTIIEVNVNVKPSFYLNKILKSLSGRLDTYALSIHLHDSDVLYYNLEKQGNSLDGYNSDYQYFLSEPAVRAEILDQRHNPGSFAELLPKGKTMEGLNALLNEGYWDAFDNNDLDPDDIPIENEKYFVDEHERCERLGKYLELHSSTAHPFVDWYANRMRLIQTGICLLRGQRADVRGK